MKRLTLKVDVDTYLGTCQGVPALLDLFDRHGVKATFLFSVGPDHTGRAIRRVFRRGFLKKVTRTSVVSHYGIRTLLYGTLLPGPHIGRRCGSILKRVMQEGHEVGVHCYDHVLWQDYVALRDEGWTRRQMVKAWDAFTDACGIHPQTIGAAGWQINPHVLAIEEELGFEYASDVRGREPFHPSFEGVTSTCLQLPTTLPTLDELLGVDSGGPRACGEKVLRQSLEPLPHGHVYTLHAELEGMKLIPVMDWLLGEWKSAEFEIGPMRRLYESLDRDRLPTCPIRFLATEGRAGELAHQSGQAQHPGPSGANCVS